MYSSSVHVASILHHPNFCCVKEQMIFMCSVFVLSRLIYHVHIYNHSYSVVKVLFCQFQKEKKCNFNLTKSTRSTVSRLLALVRPRYTCITVCYRLWSVYYWFVDSQFVVSQFIYTLSTKTSYSQLTKPQTLKLNAKPPKLFVAGY